jgi:hypothetical protein
MSTEVVPQEANKGYCGAMSEPAEHWFSTNR